MSVDITMIGIHVRSDEALRMFVERRHPDEMRCGRRRHRKRAPERFMRRATLADRQAAVLQHTVYLAGLRAIADQIDRDFLENVRGI